MGKIGCEVWGKSGVRYGENRVSRMGTIGCHVWGKLGVTYGENRGVTYGENRVSRMGKIACDIWGKRGLSERQTPALRPSRGMRALGAQSARELGTAVT